MKSFGTFGMEAHSINALQNGGYLLAGTVAMQPGQGWMLAKLTEDLEISSAFTVSAESAILSGVPFFAKELASGNIFIAGFRESTSNRRGIISLLSPSGEVLWTKTNNTWYLTPRDAVETADGEIIVVGTLNETAYSPGEGFIAKFDGQGNPIWSKYFTSPSNNEHIYSVIIADDGTIICVGNTASFEWDYRSWILKISAGGETLEQKYLSSRNFGTLLDLTRMANGNLAAIGYTIQGNFEKGFILIFNQGLEIIDNYVIHYPTETKGNFIRESEDNLLISGFLMDGYQESYGIISLNPETGVATDRLKAIQELNVQTQLFGDVATLRPNDKVLIAARQEFSVFGFDNCVTGECTETSIPIITSDNIESMDSNLPTTTAAGFIDYLLSSHPIDLETQWKCTPDFEFVHNAESSCESMDVTFTLDGSNPEGVISEVVWNVSWGGEYDGDPVVVAGPGPGTYDYTVTVITTWGAEHSASGTITIHPIFNPDLVPPQVPVCDESYTFDFSQLPGWDLILDSDGNPVSSFEFTDPGSYTFEVSGPCFQGDLLIEAVSDSMSNLLYALPPVACINQPVAFDIHVPPFIDPYQIEIHAPNGDTIPYVGSSVEMQFPNPGWHTVHASGTIGGCPYTDSIQVLIETPIVDTVVEESFCQTDVLDIDFSNLPFSVLDPNGSPVESFQTSSSGDYNFIAQNSCGQADYLIRARSIHYLPIPVSPLNPLICLERDTIILGFVPDPLVYLWSNGNTTPTVAVTDAGVYSVLVSDSSGMCSATHTFTVDSIPPGAYSIFSTDTLTLCLEGTVDLPLPDFGFPYLLPDGSSGMGFRPVTGGVVEVSFSDGCHVYDDDVWVNFRNCTCEMIVPNVFTPNGDGRNDRFVPRVHCGVHAFQIQIFNRWGREVFASTDINITWDGTLPDGSVVSDGAYFYVIRYVQKVEENLFDFALSGTVNVLGE